MTSRGKLTVVVAFFGSAVLCAAAAVALVKANDNGDSRTGTLPTSPPTLVFPSESPTPTPTPTPTATATPVPTATATVSPHASPAASVSRSPRATSSPRPSASKSPLPQGLRVSASLSQESGDTNTLFIVTGHATVGLGKINRYELRWGDGTTVTNPTVTACAAPSGGDCRNFTFPGHAYARPGHYTITLTVTSGTGAQKQVTTVQVPVTVTAPTP